MTTPDLIAAAERRLRGYAEALVHRVIFFTRVSATTADGSADGVEGWPADGGDPTGGQQTARRIEPWGVHGRPKAGVQALLARVMGGAAQGILAGIWTGGYGRQNLAEGETQLYCIATGAEVYLDKNGKVYITAASGQPIAIHAGAGANVTIDAGAGANIVLNGGTRPIACIGDTAGPYPIVSAAVPSQTVLAP